MDRKAVRGWIMYDFANSAFATTMLAAVLPIYYKSVAGIGLPENTAVNYWANTQTIAMLCVALLSPVLGAVADHAGAKVRFLGVFALLGAFSSMAMAFVGAGDWLLASVLLIVATVGFTGGNTFYDALLTDLVPKERRDTVSSQGYSVGYIGGGLLLAVNVAMIEGWKFFGFPDKTAATQAVFITVGVWWLLFSIPLFRYVKDRPRELKQSYASMAGAGFRRIWATFRKIRKFPELLKYMVSFWFFHDGINTVIIMAAIYGADIGIKTTHLIIALLITQFVGFPSTLLFGRIAVRLGAKCSLYISLSIYVVIVCLGYFMTSAAHFYVLAIMVGLVQGGSQAIARSIFANLVPLSKAAEFFGFLSLSSKFSAVAGPFVFSVVGTLTGSSRLAILALVGFFVIGMLLLMLVNLEKGRSEALAAEHIFKI